MVFEEGQSICKPCFVVVTVTLMWTAGCVESQGGTGVSKGKGQALTHLGIQGMVPFPGELAYAGPKRHSVGSARSGNIWKQLFLFLITGSARLSTLRKDGLVGHLHGSSH